jgi:hypothetical protein
MDTLPRDMLAHRPDQRHARLLLLVAAHMLACTAPLLMPLLPQDEAYVPLMWALIVPNISAMMSLSAWIGLGGSRFAVRLLGACGGIAYLAIWVTATNALQNGRAVSPRELLGDYLTAIALHLAFVGTLTGAFLVARRWWRVERMYDIATPPGDWRQFSMLNLLVLMVATAVVLTFVRIARSAPDASPGTWQWAITSAVGIGIFFANTRLGVRAALGPPPLAPRLVGASIVAALLGIALGFSGGNDAGSAWVFACSCTIIPLATMVVIGSTLVVRSCGYRLVPRSPRGKVQHALANAPAQQDPSEAVHRDEPVEPFPL